MIGAALELLNARPTPRTQAPIPRGFGDYDRIGIGIGLTGENSGVYYKCVGSNSKGHTLQRLDQSNIPEFFTHADIAELEQQEGWEYEANFFAPTTAEMTLKAGGDRFVDLPREQQQRILFKQAICDPLLVLLQTKEASRSDAGIKRGLDLIFQRNGVALDKLRGKKDADGVLIRKIPCAKTVRQEWLIPYLDSGRDPLSLLDEYHYGERKSPLDDDIQQILFDVSLLYASTKRLEMPGLIKELKLKLKPINNARAAQGLKPHKCPDRDTLWSRIEANGAFYNLAGRTTPEEARAHFGMVTNGLEVTRPGERLEMDFWTINLMTFIQGTKLWWLLSPKQKDEIEKAKDRWKLCLALDGASRAILAMRMSATETADAAVATLEMAMIDKAAYALNVGARSTWHMYVGCETLATDQGSAFLSKEFRAACASAKIKFVNPPAGMPNMRGRVERIFRTVDIQALCHLAGRTFGSIDERGNFNPADFTSLTLEQLAIILVLYVIDIYHNEPHESLGGRTPAHEFDSISRKYGTVAPPDATRRRNAFGVHLDRTITMKGVRVLNLFFNSPALNQYFRRVGDGHKTEVIFSPHDLGTVSVRVGPRSFINVQCVTPELKGVTATAWIAACQDMRRRFAKENIPSEAIALATLADIIAMGDAARLAANIASPLINAKTVERFEKMIEIPWRSREAALANPNAGGDFLANLIPSAPKSDFQPPIEPPPVRKPRTAPQDWSDVDPETGEITPSTNPEIIPPTNPEGDGDTDLPEGWTLED